MLLVSPWAACSAASLAAGADRLAHRPPGAAAARATTWPWPRSASALIVYRVVLGTQCFGAGRRHLRACRPCRSCPASRSTAAGLRVQNYYIAWALVAGGMLLLINLIHSRVGRALRAIHEREDAASAMGVDTRRYKLTTFVLSALLAAVAGVFLTHYNGGIGPSEASVMKSVRYVAIVAVGGMANLWGTLLMSTLLNFLSLRGFFGTYDDAVFGAILIVDHALRPAGPARLSGLAAY